jgi:hypothetical protein
VKNGIYAANFGGGQVDITSGKYVFQCTEAYKIENGKLGAPLKGAMLIGNGPTDLHRITMIGNDLEARYRHRHLRQERPGRAGRRRPADAAHRCSDGRGYGDLRARPMRPEEVLPDDVNRGEIDGVSIRKGSVGAFLANARVLADPAASAQDRSTAERDLIALLPALRALGLFDVLAIRDEKLRALVDRHLAGG